MDECLMRSFLQRVTDVDPGRFHRDRDFSAQMTFKKEQVEILHRCSYCSDWATLEADASTGFKLKGTIAKALLFPADMSP